MASANSLIQVTELDFDQIKNSFIQYLQGLPNSPFQDVNFSGSTISTLLDILAYNTHYQGYYLNIVANEMFLDTAAYRSSVVSHAKMLSYTPKSAIAPTATVNVVVNGVTSSSLTMPINTIFMSEQINGVNYAFTTMDTYTVNTDTANGIATFANVEIKQGQPLSYSYPVDTASNPETLFEISDSNIDTTSLIVDVYSASSGLTVPYTLSTNYLTLSPTSQVYFLQEGTDGNYQIYFGDGILGQALTNDNTVNISWISTGGTAAAGANNFVIQGNIGGFANIAVNSIVQASTGGDQESIQSIKFQAPKAYSAQGRAVTQDDYITLIQQNTLGYSFDAVNVWGGEENNPPVYGQVFVSLKPTGSYTLTDIQKQQIIEQVINPISVMTVVPQIVDPDYTYITINANVVYNQKQTTNSSSQVNAEVVTAIQNFATATLNTFNSTFSLSNLVVAINNADPSIVANEATINLEKKIYPNDNTPTTYTLDFATQLQKGILLSGISSSPAMQFYDATNGVTIDGIYIEEVPSSTGGVQSINIINPGYSYQYAPTVTILGDGTGATAVATINYNGNISSITVTNAGSGYTSSVVVITPAQNDSTGQQGAATAILEGQYGTLRTYYYNSSGIKTIFNDNVGTVDYINGIITLSSFNPTAVDNPLGELTITATPTTTLLSSSFNKILTVDPSDPTAISVNVTAAN